MISKNILSIVISLGLLGSFTSVYSAQNKNTVRPVLPKYSSGAMMGETQELESKAHEDARIARNSLVYAAQSQGLQRIYQVVYAMLNGGHHRNCPSQNSDTQCMSQKINNILTGSNISPEDRKMIDDLIRRERRYTLCTQPCLQQRFYAFYHGHDSASRVLYHCLAQIMEFERQSPLKNFIPVRLWRGSEIPQITDSSKYAREVMSNAHIAHTAQEYMIADFAPMIQPEKERYKTPDALMNGFDAQKLEKYLKNIFAVYDFNPKYIEQLLKLNSWWMYGGKGMLQMFIPQDLVDQSVCLIHKNGLPCNKKSGSVVSILDSIQSGEFAQRNHMNAEELIRDTRAVIHIGKDIMLNPESGIRINHISYEDHHGELFLIDLKTIMREVYADFLKRKSKSDPLVKDVSNKLGRMAKLKSDAVEKIVSSHDRRDLRREPLGDLLQDRDGIGALKDKLEHDNMVYGNQSMLQSKL
jgi:hypothetical protein